MKMTDEQQRDFDADMAAGRAAHIAAMARDDAKNAPVIEPPKLTQEEKLARAFPDVDSGAKPLGARILVQLKATDPEKTESGIIMVKETTDAEKFNNMVGKVMSIGPLAFKKRDTMEPWPEGAWCAVGDYIRVPKWGGDRWEVPYGDQKERALFVVLNDHEVIAAVTCDPLSMKAIY